MSEAVNPADIAMDWLRDNYGEGIPGVKYVDGDRLYAELVAAFAEDGYHVVQDAIYRRMRHGDELLAQVEDGDVFVVQEGQAVVNGEVFAIEEHGGWTDPTYRLRPLPEPPPVVDEMTTTTTTEPE